MQLAALAHERQGDSDGRTTLVFALAIGIAGLGLAGLGASQAEEQTFVKEAVQGNLAEVRLGELASQRAENPDVRKYGQTLRQDHWAAFRRATNIAKSLKVEPPTEPTDEANRHYDGLSQLSGGQFDAAFVSHMIVAHEAEIAKYSRNASSDNDGVAAFVADALPKMRAHLVTAQALQKAQLTPPHDR